MAAFLASDRASFVTGAIIPVDGGWIAQVALIAKSSSGRQSDVSTTTESALSYDPYDVEHQRRSVSRVPAAPRGGAAVPQRRLRLLRAQPVRGRRARSRRPRHLHLEPGRHPRADPGRHRDAARARSSSRTRRSTRCTAACCRASSRRRRWRRSNRRSGSSASAASIRWSAPAVSTSSATSVPQMPMRVIGMLLGIPEEDQEVDPRPRRRPAADHSRGSR